MAAESVNIAFTRLAVEVVRTGDAAARTAVAYALSHAVYADAIVECVLTQMNATNLPGRKTLLELLDSIAQKGCAGGGAGLAFRDAIGTRIRRLAMSIVPPRSEAPPSMTAALRPGTDSGGEQLYRAAAAVVTAEQGVAYQRNRTENKWALTRVFTAWWRTGAVPEASIDRVRMGIREAVERGEGRTSKRTSASGDRAQAQSEQLTKRQRREYAQQRQQQQQEKQHHGSTQRHRRRFSSSGSGRGARRSGGRSNPRTVLTDSCFSPEFEDMWEDAGVQHHVAIREDAEYSDEGSSSETPTSDVEVSADEAATTTAAVHSRIQNAPTAAAALADAAAATAVVAAVAAAAALKAPCVAPEAAVGRGGAASTFGHDGSAAAAFSDFSQRFAASRSLSLSR